MENRENLENKLQAYIITIAPKKELEENDNRFLDCPSMKSLMFVARGLNVKGDKHSVVLEYDLATFQRLDGDNCGEQWENDFPYVAIERPSDYKEKIAIQIPKGYKVAFMQIAFKPNL